MVIQPSVVAAAEKRVPPEIVKPRPARRDLVEEALIPLGLPQAPTLTDNLTFARRATHLGFAGAKPSTTELERLIGNDDLVDEFYLQRSLVAAGPVMRITLRDAAGRERGWATGVMVSPRLLLTNWHVFMTEEDTHNAIAEAHYVLDIGGNPAPSYRFAIRGDLFYSSDQQLDYSLVAVDPVAQDGRTQLAQYGYHRLVAEPNKIREGEAITLIQHPGGERRQFAIRENSLEKILENFLWYKGDTAPGSSGAPAFNDSFQIVALHHSGAAKRDDGGLFVLRDGSKVASLDGIDDSQVDWVANEGLRVSVLCAFLRTNLNPDNPYARELFQAMQGGDVMSNAISGKISAPPASGQEVTSAPFFQNGAALTIPLQLQISLSLGAPVAGPAIADVQRPVASAMLPVLPVGTEALRFPIVDRDYTSRVGYDANFLGILVPLPEIQDDSLVSKMADGNHVIPYEHFSIVVNKQRRLPLFTASNLDYSPLKRKPEPGDYSRRGLTGLGPNDQEKWLTDPRIPQQDQLPDVFYTKDNKAFDKGHVVRREDMCWGDSRDQIVRANGDTFHVTNCTPQIAGFNRSTLGVDDWGDLENEIQGQAKTEKLTLLAGPILAEGDKIFVGKDDFGPVEIQIPDQFWKVVLATDNGQLAAFAFILKQDLQDVPLEFRVSPTWKPHLVSVGELEKQLTGFSFSQEIHAADQSAHGADEVATALGVKVHPSLIDHPPT